MENVLGNRIPLFPSHCGYTWETFTSVCLPQQFYVFFVAFHMFPHARKPKNGQANNIFTEQKKAHLTF